MIPDTRKQWYYTQNNQQNGPVPYTQLQQIAANGQIAPQRDKVWCEGLANWIQAGQVEGLFPQATPAPPPPPPQAALQAPPMASPYAPPMAQSAATIQPGSVKRASFGLLMSMGGVYILSFILGMTLIIIGDSENEDALMVIGGIFAAIGMIAVIALAIMTCMYVYRMWKMIQDGHARTTPGKAVGFMFIPLFSLYWIFVVYHGWSQDYNAFIVRHGRQGAPEVKEGLFLAMPILALCSIVPFVGILAALGSIIVSIMCFYQLCRAINYFADGR